MKSYYLFFICIVIATNQYVHGSEKQKKIVKISRDDFFNTSRRNQSFAQSFITKERTNLTNSKGMTLLTAACKDKNYVLASLLLLRGADPDLPSKYNITPLIAATTKNSFSIVTLLLSFKAQTDIRYNLTDDVRKNKDYNNQTALELAETLNHKAIATILRKHDEFTPPLPLQQSPSNRLDIEQLL